MSVPVQVCACGSQVQAPKIVVDKINLDLLFMNDQQKESKCVCVCEDHG